MPARARATASLRRFVNGHGVVAVNGDARNVVGCAAVGDVLDGLDGGPGHGNAVVVVLAHENDGSFQMEPGSETREGVLWLVEPSPKKHTQT